MENLGLEVKWHGRVENEAAHYCNVCEVNYPAHAMCGSRRGTGYGPPEQSQKYRVSLAILVLKNYKATKPASNVGPQSAHQQNAI